MTLCWVVQTYLFIYLSGLNPLLPLRFTKIQCSPVVLNGMQQLGWSVLNWASQSSKVQPKKTIRFGQISNLNQLPNPSFHY